MPAPHGRFALSSCQLWLALDVKDAVGGPGASDQKIVSGTRKIITDEKIITTSV
jgi:hypothetical protein